MGADWVLSHGRTAGRSTRTDAVSQSIDLDHGGIVAFRDVADFGRSPGPDGGPRRRRFTDGHGLWESHCNRNG